MAEAPAIVAGLPVVKEVFGRLGVRTRPVLAEGSQAAAGDVVAEVGGALAAIRGAAPVALTWLQRLSGVATGAVAPEPGAPLDDHAARLSRAAAVGEADPSFRPSGPPAIRPSFRMEFVD